MLTGHSSKKSDQQQLAQDARSVVKTVRNLIEAERMYLHVQIAELVNMKDVHNMLSIFYKILLCIFMHITLILCTFCIILSWYTLYTLKDI